jgi:hypothetical protein
MNTYTPAQVFIRGFVYLAIAVATELLSVLSAGEVEPRIAGVKIFIAGLLTLRAYLDKTPSHTEENGS